MSRARVFLTGGDGMGWALDDDLDLTRRALGETVVETSLEDAGVVHSVWWEGLSGVDPASLAGKRVVCGGTTANIVARRLGRGITVELETGTDSVPATGRIDEIDLVTEGTLTTLLSPDGSALSGSSLQ